MQGLNFFLEIHYMVRISTKTMSNVNCDVIGATRCYTIAPGATGLHENWRDFTRLSRDLAFITVYGQNKH